LAFQILYRTLSLFLSLFQIQSWTLLDFQCLDLFGSDSKSQREGVILFLRLFLRGSE